MRLRLIIPLLRSPHPPEYTARGVANGVFWGLTPTAGVMTLGIVAVWLALKKVARLDSSLLQALLWMHVNNPLTMLPMYYLFYVTGEWLLGEAGVARGYDAFVAIWSVPGLGFFDRLSRAVTMFGAPLMVGSLPYALVASAFSYRWALAIVRRRRRRPRPEAGPRASDAAGL